MRMRLLQLVKAAEFYDYTIASLPTVPPFGWGSLQLSPILTAHLQVSAVPNGTATSPSGLCLEMLITPETVQWSLSPL